MASLGFWGRAQQSPDWIAAIEPDGTEHRAGDLLARVNQITHGLRALGLRPGDGIYDNEGPTQFLIDVCLGRPAVDRAPASAGVRAVDGGLFAVGRFGTILKSSCGATAAAVSISGARPAVHLAPR